MSCGEAIQESNRDLNICFLLLLTPRALVKKWGFTVKEDSGPASDVTRESTYGKGTTEAIQRSRERQFMQDPRALWKFYVLGTIERAFIFLPVS